MYKMFFYDKNGKKYDFCEFALCVGEMLTDKLEEVLYIMQELTPLHMNWKRDLIECGECLFSYHNAEVVRVIYNWNGNPIEVRDC